MDRDRSWLAAAEVGIAVGMLVAMALPWWSVTPTTADRIPTGPAYSVGINGLGQTGFTDADLFARIGPPIVLVVVFLAAWLSRRGLIVLALIGFLSTLTVGAAGLIDQANLGLIGYFPTRPDVGLQLLAWLGLAGTVVTAIDLTRDGTTTRLWRLPHRV